MRMKYEMRMKSEMRMRICNCNIADTAGSWNEGQRERTLRSMGGILINNGDGEK